MALSDQVPTKSGFGAKSTGDEVLAGIELKGKSAIVTGGYSGIGLEVVRCLAARGVKVLVPVRSPEKAAETLDGLAGEVETAPMDLADIASVWKFAANALEVMPTLDLLINNAGIMACPEARVGPGWESQFGVNHMGHFALTKALMPALSATPGARVVALSSAAHRMSDIHWDDIQFQTHDYDKWQAYGQAKTANALFANALSRRLRDTGGLAFSLHPGGIWTPLQRHLPQEELIALGWLAEDGSPSEMAARMFKTVEEGASTTLWCATSPALDGKPGVYCEDWDVAAPHDPNDEVRRFFGVAAYAADDDAAERLWELSESYLAVA